MTRRDFLRLAVLGSATAALTPNVFAGVASAARRTRTSAYGELLAPDRNGVMLPAGFTSRVVAVSGQPVAATSYAWHHAPDGGACFALSDGGWVYVSNSELGGGAGGVSFLRFDNGGSVVGAGRALEGTHRNCAGGPTPWGTWLSCEEIETGLVWECDPLGRTPATSLPSLGRFNHEAAVVDKRGKAIYLTEDQWDGGLYRFRPTRWPRLDAGRLEVMTEVDGVLGWTEVPDPSAASVATRHQVTPMKQFRGGEGAWFDGTRLLFTTKGDNRVWSYVPATNHLSVVYDIATATNPVLSGVDNVVANGADEIFVAEDGGDMQLVCLHPDGTVAPFLQVVGHDGSELTGPAFDPSGTRLYFSEQTAPGTTFEVTGPFNRR